MSLAIDNAQFNRFVQFAEQQMRAGNTTAIARGGEAAGQDPLAGRKIVAATGDKTAPIFGRSDTNKLANNDARRLFRDSIISIFGSEANIPQSVKNAMKLADYDQGKPLTARRIIAVKVAIEAVAQPHVEFNDSVRSSVQSGNLGNLPENIKSALAGLVDEMRGIFGEGVVPPGAKIDKIVHLSLLPGGIGDLCSAASSHVRHVSADEVVALFRANAISRLADETVGAAILAKIGNRVTGIPSTARSLATQFDGRYPGIVASIRSCTSSVDVANVLHAYEDKIDAFADAVARCNIACKTVEAKAAERLAAALGLSASLIAEHVPTNSVRTAAFALATSIAKGTAAGSRDPGFDIEAAFDAVVDDFVQKRVALCAEIDSLDLPQDVKRLWKADMLGLNSLPKLSPAQLFNVAKSVDARKLEGALAAGLPQKIAMEMLNNAVKQINDAVVRELGDPQLLKNAATDDLMPIYSMMIAVAESRNPNLAPAVEAVRNTFFVPANQYCEANALAKTATFVKSLVLKGGTDKQVSTMLEPKFMAAAEKELDATLAGAGVKDAKVVKDVKAVMLARARAALKNAVGLDSLDAFLATMRADAAALGKALDAVAKARASTLADAADAIAAETGMGKAYVMNNLAVSDIASDSGKLRFLYSGVVSKAKEGTMPDPEAVADKAKKIVGDFARAKIDIVKSIEAAGFDAVERAAHIANALKDPAWLDPDVPAVAKRLAGDATMKNAARLLAGALQKNVAASLDDMQLRDVFIAFGKAFTQVFLSNDFRAYSDKWTGQSETLARLQRMLLQFIGKDFPDLVPALASLSAEGRLANVVTHLSNRLNEIHSLKMDYMTLDQAGLKGPPAGEAIRGVMNNPNLVYDEAAFKRCDEDDAACNLTSVFLSMMVGAVPRAGADANAVERCAARQAKGREIAAKYAEGLAQETLPLLKNVVDALDWREASAAASEETVKNFVNDMKTWRDIAPGSQDSAGLESVMVRRMDGYLKDVLAGNTGSASFNTNQHPGLFETFLMDLTRASYTINGKKLEGAKLEERLPDFMDAIKDPAKRKIVSVMVNQQIFGDFSSSIANLLPLDGWKNGMEPEDVAGIPGIGKFATRDISKSGCPLYGTSPMAFEIDVSDDESTVKVRATSAFPLNFDLMNPKAQAGTCTISQEFTIDLSGPEPAIRDLKIGQALS